MGGPLQGALEVETLGAWPSSVSNQEEQNKSRSSNGKRCVRQSPFTRNPDGWVFWRSSKIYF